MKNKKILILIICLLFLITTIISTVISSDCMHIQKCHTDHCSKCILIHLAINNFNNINKINIFALILSMIIFIKKMTEIKLNNKNNKTLIECKVQQNI